MNGPLLTSTEIDTLADLLANPGGVDVGSLRRHTPATEPIIDKLRSLGCDIEPVGTDGYRLLRTGLSVWSDYAEHALARAGMPRRVRVFRRTASTQDVARRHADEPCLVLADEQTAGRGRLGRTWHAPRGTAVLMSLTHPMAPDDSPDRITFAVSVAVANVCGPAERVHIKWPNDIVADGRKIAGILVETLTLPRAGRVAIIGVGLNVHVTGDMLAAYPEEVRNRVGSLAMIGSARDRLRIAVDTVEAITRNLRERHEELLLAEWRARNVLHDQHVRLLADGSPVSGVVTDLDPREGLILRRDSGELIHLPAATTTVV